MVVLVYRGWYLCYGVTLNNMYSILCGCVIGHALFKGPDTFKHDYPLVHPTKLRRSTSLWQEPYAAEAASQIAMWITVESNEFPTLQWEVLAENVLAHYVPGTHHMYDHCIYSSLIFKTNLLL